MSVLCIEFGKHAEVRVLEEDEIHDSLLTFGFVPYEPKTVW